MVWLHSTGWFLPDIVHVMWLCSDGDGYSDFIVPRNRFQIFLENIYFYLFIFFILTTNWHIQTSCHLLHVGFSPSLHMCKAGHFCFHFFPHYGYLHLPWFFAENIFLTLNYCGNIFPEINWTCKCIAVVCFFILYFVALICMSVLIKYIISYTYIK